MLITEILHMDDKGILILEFSGSLYMHLLEGPPLRITFCGTVKW